MVTALVKVLTTLKQIPVINSIHSFGLQNRFDIFTKLENYLRLERSWFLDLRRDSHTPVTENEKHSSFPAINFFSQKPDLLLPRISDFLQKFFSQCGEHYDRQESGWKTSIFWNGTAWRLDMIFWVLERWFRSGPAGSWSASVNCLRIRWVVFSLCGHWTPEQDGLGGKIFLLKKEILMILYFPFREVSITGRDNSCRHFHHVHHNVQERPHLRPVKFVKADEA